MDYCISTNIDRKGSISEWYQAVQAAGFRSLALNQDFAHCSYEEHTGRLQLLADASAHDMRYALLFVPSSSEYDISCRHGETRMGAVCGVANSMYAAKVLGCAAVVLGVTHSLPTRHGSDTASVLHALEGLVETAENMGINLLLRNLIDSRSLDTFKAALAEYRSLKFGVCYNPALDLLSQQSPYRILEDYTERIMAMQLADSDRKSSYHLLPFSGLVDWHRIAAFLSATEQDMPLHLDCLPLNGDGSAEALQLVCNVADRLKELVDRN